MADRKRKPERKSHVIVHVDGSRKPWGQFKREFEKEVKERTEQGNRLKNAQFVLNQDKSNEKLLEWHYRNGFSSEDSDDEMVIYRRTERQFYRKLRQEHGEDTTLL